MKNKLYLMGRVAIALVLALSLSLVMTVPVSALTEPVVTVAPTAVGQTAEYIIVFTTAEDLAVTADDDIRVEFPEGTAVPGSYGAGDITINTINAGDKVESVVDRLVTIDVPEDVAKGTVTVVFKTTATIENPSIIDAYTLEVSTSREVTPVPSAEYNITAPAGPVDLYDDSTPLVYVDSYDTINEAIVAASPDFTIKVHAGIYTENVIIHEDITLESYDGAATTTIDASAETGPAAVAITANGVTLGGAGVGFTIIAMDYDSAAAFFNPTGIHLTGAVDNVTIEDNVITGGNLSPQLGIQIGTDLVTEIYSDIQILNNSFSTTWDVETAVGLNTTCGGIKSWPTATLDGTLLIDDNDITGFTVGINLRNLQGTDEVPAIISNNTVNGNGYNGIEVGGDNTDYLEIRGNHIYDNGGNGVAISEGSVTHVKVEQNDIYGNGNGVKVYNGVAIDSISINYNDIYNNTNTTVTHSSYDPDNPFTYENYGVFNDNEADGSDLDAKYNFWSDPGATPLDISGPSSATYTADEAASFWAGTALGTGDIAGAAATSATVSATVLYDPWLTEDYATVIDSGKRSYGSDAILLEKGWNTLSVPCGLKGSADTFVQIEDLGDFLTDANFAGGYSYDANANDWVLIGDSTTLEPGKGFYVQMKAASRFPILYFDGFLDLPAYDMYEGWNLIGSTFGIDKGAGTIATDVGDYGVPTLDADDNLSPITTNEDIESYMDKDAALDSISVACSVVVSPSVPGQLIAWAEVYDGITTGAVMLVGESYWVFMTANGTLAGFEVTPFCFEPGTMP